MTRTNTIGETISAHDGHEDLPRGPTAEDAQEVAADICKLIDSAPASIWLDLGEDFDMTLETDFRDLREVSWSEDNATGVGIKYVRAPVAVATSDAPLLPCPFCGGPATMIDRLSGPLIPGAFVSCDACDISTPIRETLGECSAGWNRRAALPIDFKEATDQVGWQPISTAPKDGTNVLLTNGAHVAQGWWEHEEPSIREQRDLAGVYLDQQEHDGFDDWLDCDGGMQPSPTHWQPMPAAPTLLGVADGDAVGGKSGGAA